MPKLLLAEGVRAWQPFHRLMMALLRFLEPYLRSAHLTDAVRLLYKVGRLAGSGTRLRQTDPWRTP